MKTSVPSAPLVSDCLDVGRRVAHMTHLLFLKQWQQGRNVASWCDGLWLTVWTASLLGECAVSLRKYKHEVLKELFFI